MRMVAIGEVTVGRTPRLVATSLANSIDGMLEGAQRARSVGADIVELRIDRTEPGVRGDTASGGTKPAKLESGAVVQVPLFLEEGDIIKIDTRTGEYIERITK